MRRRAETVHRAPKPREATNTSAGLQSGPKLSLHDDIRGRDVTSPDSSCLAVCALPGRLSLWSHCDGYLRPTASAQQPDPAIAPSGGENTPVVVMSGVGQIPCWRRFHVRMSAGRRGIRYAASGNDHDGLHRTACRRPVHHRQTGYGATGYATIRDQNGKAIAIVGIDVDEGDIASLKFDVLKPPWSSSGLPPRASVAPPSWLDAVSAIRWA